MTDDAHTPRTAAAAARTSDTASAHADGPVCAFPGCDEHLELSSEPGRPASYCGGTTTGADGRNYPHDRAGAYRWKRKYGQQAAEAEPATAATSSTGGSGGEWSATVARKTAVGQARELAVALEQLPVHLAQYVQVLQHAADPDAVAADAERQRRQYERDLAAAEQARDDAQAAADAALAEKGEAEQIADEALARADDSEIETARVREQSERAQADADRARAEARQQVADAEQRAADALAEADRRVQAAEQDSEQRVAEAHAQADETVRAARADHARELENVRAEAEERARGAEARANEAEQQAGRAEQRAVDAEGQGQWLRNQLDQLRAQYREDVAAVRGEADQRIADLRAAYEGRASSTQTEEADDERPT